MLRRIVFPDWAARLSSRSARSGGFALSGILLLVLITYAQAAAGTDSRSDGVPADMDGATGNELDRDVILITGSTSGLGRELALRLSRTGAHVIVHGRDEERGATVVREIEEEGIGSASFHAADLASLDEVRTFASTVQQNHDRLDVLINNAGIPSAPDGRAESADGYELVFQVNYLSHFLLTHELLPLIRASPSARIVNISSGAQAPIDFDDVMLEEEGAIDRAYAQSKLAQILHAFDLAEELAEDGVTVNTLHPATYMDTRMLQQAGVEPRTTVDEGAVAVMQLVTDDIGSGGYFNGLIPAEAHAQAYDEEARRQLRELSRELVGIEPGGR